MADHKIDGNNGAGNVDLIRRIDAMQACQVGPSDEWAKATKDGYNQAATDCAMALLKCEPVPPTLSAAMELPEVPTDAQLHYACLSYRHDYGLMDLVSREKLQWECREWWRCISRAAIAPPEA